MICLELPIQTVSEANRESHEHWRTRHQRAKRQRVNVVYGLYEALKGEGIVGQAIALHIHLVRVSPRMLDEGDNLPASMKHVRDGILLALARTKASTKRVLVGRGDGPNDGIRFTYGQEKSPRAHYQAVRIMIARETLTKKAVGE